MGFPKPWPTEWPEADPRSPWYDESESPPKDEDDGDELDDLERQPELRGRFSSVTWAVNHACNLHCTHCYDAVEYRRQDLGTQEAFAVLHRLALAGVRFIAFSGGEPLLRKDLFDLMEQCSNLDIRFGLRCNGTKITAEVANRLKGLGIAVVGVSFDGATEETHDAVRGSKGFLAATGGLRALVKAGIRVQVEVVLSRANAHEASEFVNMGASLGAAEVNFSAIAPQGRGRQRSSDLLTPLASTELVTELRDLASRAPIPVTPNCAFCGPCWANIEPHVTCDGWMTPCYLSSIRLFRILDTPPESIRDLLSRDRLKYQDVCGRRAWVASNERSGESGSH